VSGTRTRQGWLIHCFGPGCSDLAGGDWLRAVAEQTGAPSGGHVKLNPEAWLTVATGGKAESRPSAAARGVLADAPLDRWAGRLWSKENLAQQALEWLVSERLLSLDVIRRYGLGWSGSEITLPLTRNGVIVGCKLRYPSARHTTIAWSGLRREYSFPLYPEPAARSVLLCAGELDALAALSAGIPACSVTMGAGTWLDEYTAALKGRRVAVCFDVGEEQWAEQRAARLPTASVVRLPLPGSPGPKDVTDYLREHSGTALRRLIKG
jgi:hypothetical protein